jgi:hypothetical protein
LPAMNRGTMAQPNVAPQTNRKSAQARADQPIRQHLELWMALARLTWRSLVLVPADPDGSTAALARALADIGQRLSFGPVTAVTIDELEFGTALALADLQQHLDRNAGPFAQEGPVVETSIAAAPAEKDELPVPEPTGSQGETIPPPPATTALTVVPPARLIISIPAVIREPLGLAATREADAVVVTVQMRRTRLPDARRTIELVGRERVAGCYLTA